MYRLIFVAFVFASPLLADNIVCEAWVQKAGEKLQTKEMKITKNTGTSVVLSTKFEGYDFAVDWDKDLTTLYTTIAKDNQRILFTTGRVFTKNHPECFTDLNLPGGLRLAVNCEEPVSYTHLTLPTKA